MPSLTAAVGLDVRLSQFATAAIGFFLVGLVALADINAGKQVGFSIFYLLPVLFAAWFGNRAIVVLICTLAGAAFPITEILVDVVYRQEWIPYWNFVSRSSTYLVVGFLANTLRSALRHEKVVSRTDPLTGALNARSFYESASVEIARSHRNRSVLTVAYLDLDGFKAVNDDLGHSAGDEVLRLVTNTLEKQIRPSDIIARMGGDEFALLLPETDEAGARSVLERACRAVREAAADSDYDITVSIGAATFQNPPVSVDELLWPADQLMYSAKRAGKNEVRLRSMGAGLGREPIASG